MKNPVLLIALIQMLTFGGNAQLLLVDAGANRHLCNTPNGLTGDTVLGGDIVVLGGLPPYTYEWSFDYSTFWYTFQASDIMNDSTLAHPVIIRSIHQNTLDLPSLTLKVTDALGATGYDTVKVTFSDFVVNLDYWSIGINQGDSIFLDKGSNVGGGIHPLHYHWTPEQGVLNPDELYFWTKPNSSVVYNVVVTDSMGCVLQGPPFYYIYVRSVGVDELTGHSPLKILQSTNGTIEVQLPDTCQLLGLTLLSASGQQMLTSQSNRLDVNTLSRGVYIISAETNFGPIRKTIYTGF